MNRYIYFCISTLSAGLVIPALIGTDLAVYTDYIVLNVDADQYINIYTFWD